MKLQLDDFDGIVYTDAGENTLALFLLYMNLIPKSEPEISDNILKLYLQKENLQSLGMQYYPDLNEKLNAIDS